jgi:hypothetical protein
MGQFASFNSILEFGRQEETMCMPPCWSISNDYNTLEDLKNDWIRLQNPTTTLSSKCSKLPCLLNFHAPKNKQNKKERKKNMATNFLSTANPFHLASSSQSSVPSISSHVYNNPIKCNVKRQLTLCKVVNPSVTKRGISISFVTSLVLSLTGKGLFDANAAILEADDDVELLEKVKKDRKKRLEKQGVISSSTKETGNVHC